MQYYCCRVDLSSQRTSCCCKGANVIAAESCGVTKLRWVCRHSVRCADHLKISSLANTSLSLGGERKITTDPPVNLELARRYRNVATGCNVRLTFFRLWGLEFRLRIRKRGIFSVGILALIIAASPSFYAHVYVFISLRPRADRYLLLDPIYVAREQTGLHFPRFIRHSFRFNKR